MATTKNGTIPQPVSLRSVRQVVAAQQRTMDALPDVYRELEGRIQVLEGQRREARHDYEDLVAHVDVIGAEIGRAHV